MKASNPKQAESSQQPLFNSVGQVEQFIDDSTRDKLLVSLLALDSVNGIGFRTLCAIFDSGFLKYFPSLDSNLIYHQLSLLPSKPRNDSIHHVCDKKERLLENGYKTAEEFRKQGIYFVPLGHKDYPKSLHRIQTSPRWIFGKGNLEAIHSSSMVAVVGTRKPSGEGAKLAYQCANELAIRNLIVLSGLAEGIDEKAHKGAVDYYGQSIGVLGHGINADYASINQDLVLKILDNDGAIISEYLPSDPPSRENFLRRNELIAAIARVVIPIESPSLDSGTGATIRRAMNLKTPVVGIIPATGPGNSLLKTKSNLLELGYRVFTISNGNSKDFWDYLKTILPQHNWDEDSGMRQDRVFRAVERQLLEARTKKQVPFDNQVIDRLAEQLKRNSQK